jgi:hypothetical protein
LPQRVGIEAGVNAEQAVVVDHDLKRGSVGGRGGDGELDESWGVGAVRLVRPGGVLGEQTALA